MESKRAQKLDKFGKMGTLGKGKCDNFMFITMLVYVIYLQTDKSQNHSEKKVEHTEVSFLRMQNKLANF